MRIPLLTFFVVCLLVACAPTTPAAPPVQPTLAAPVATSATIAEEVAEATATLPPAPEAATATPDNFLDEIKVEEIRLGGALAEADAEISGMAWHKDTLILLPQFPERYDGNAFGIPKAMLEAYLNGAQTDPIEPQIHNFNDGGLSESIDGFEGYEAIAIVSNQIFVTIEARLTATTMTGYLVRGEITASGSMGLKPETLVELPAPVPLENYSDEAITISGNQLYTFYEANGATVNPEAVAHVFTLSDLTPQGTLPLTPLEYRLTDATPADSDKRFWVINYLFPGDIAKLRLAPDAFKAEYGEGRSHSSDMGIERLLQFQITESGIEPVDVPPIYLELEIGNPRNWEGIVEWENEGFLLVTDKFPETLLGFVPYPH